MAPLSVTQEMGGFVVWNVTLALPEVKVRGLTASFVDSGGNQIYLWTYSLHVLVSLLSEILLLSNISFLLISTLRKKGQLQLLCFVMICLIFNPFWGLDI